MRKFVVLAVLALVVGIIAMTGGLALAAHTHTDPVDQEQLSGTQNSHGMPIGQTFTPTVDNITGFDIVIGTSSLCPADTYTIEIWHWASKVALTNFTDALVQGENHVDLPTPVSLTPGVKYALMLVDGPRTCLSTVANTYLGGAFVKGEKNPPEAPTEKTPLDAFFRTHFAAAVGGIAEVLVDSSGGPVSPGDGAGSSSLPYAAIAGGITAAAVAVAAGGWYARRRWLQ
ncbi:MAG: hypothetical protein IH864_05130 [Chloroflexi bacterium]|nr:hypothetical protein [Chloroflexota bacterium]